MLNRGAMKRPPNNFHFQKKGGEPERAHPLLKVRGHNQKPLGLTASLICLSRQEGRGLM